MCSVCQQHTWRLDGKMECDGSTVPPVGLIEGCCGTFHQQVGLVCARVSVCVCVVSPSVTADESLKFYKRTKNRTEMLQCSGFFLVQTGLAVDQ